MTLTIRSKICMKSGTEKMEKGKEKKKKMLLKKKKSIEKTMEGKIKKKLIKKKNRVKDFLKEDSTLEKKNKHKSKKGKKKKEVTKKEMKKVVKERIKENKEETEEEIEEKTEEETENETEKETEKDMKEQTDVLQVTKSEEFFDRSNVFLLFEDTVLDVRLRKSILYIFQFKHPTKIQSYAIPHILKGNDVFINSKTGSGKTLAYLIPSIQKLIKLNINEKEHLKFFYKCIIIAPTDVLCLQIYEVTQKLCKYLKDLVTVAHNINTNAIDYSTIFISTPKNLYKYIIEKKKRQNIDVLSNLKVLIIDEADVLHNEDFKKCMNKLKTTFPKSFSQKFQVIMASATLKKTIVEKSKVLLHNPVFVNINGTVVHLKVEEMTEKLFEQTDKNKLNLCSQNNQGKKNSIHHVINFNGKSYYYTYEEEITKYIILYCLLKNQTIPFKSIFFTTTIYNAYKLKIFLTYFNISAIVLNPEYSILIRQNIIDIFNQNKCYCLICPQFEKKKEIQLIKEAKYLKIKKETDKKGNEEKGNESDEQIESEEENEEENENENEMEEEKDYDNITDDENEKDFLFNRGLDYQEMKCVVNFDMALNRETFLHRIGRTCRLTNDGIAISFINEKDEIEKQVLQEIINKNISKMEQKTILYTDIESFRYRVESVLVKCKKHKIKNYMFRENVVLTKQSKEMKHIYRPENKEQSCIQKIILNVEKHTLMKKCLNDINSGLFLFANNNKNKNNKYNWNKNGHIKKKGYNGYTPIGNIYKKGTQGYTQGYIKNSKESEYSLDICNMTRNKYTVNKINGKY